MNLVKRNSQVGISPRSIPVSVTSQGRKFFSKSPQGQQQKSMLYSSDLHSLQGQRTRSVKMLKIYQKELRLKINRRNQNNQKVLNNSKSKSSLLIDSGRSSRLQSAEALCQDLLSDSMVSLQLRKAHRRKSCCCNNCGIQSEFQKRVENIWTEGNIKQIEAQSKKRIQMKSQKTILMKAQSLKISLVEKVNIGAIFTQYTPNDKRNIKGFGQQPTNSNKIAQTVNSLRFKVVRGLAEESKAKNVDKKIAAVQDQEQDQLVESQILEKNNSQSLLNQSQLELPKINNTQKMQTQKKEIQQKSRSNQFSQYFRKLQEKHNYQDVQQVLQKPYTNESDFQFKIKNIMTQKYQNSTELFSLQSQKDLPLELSKISRDSQTSRSGARTLREIYNCYDFQNGRLKTRIQSSLGNLPQEGAEKRYTRISALPHQNLAKTERRKPDNQKFISYIGTKKPNIQLFV